jgi:hypothetical protein
MKNITIDVWGSGGSYIPTHENVMRGTMARTEDYGCPRVVLNLAIAKGCRVKKAAIQEDSIGGTKGQRGLLRA